MRRLLIALALMAVFSGIALAAYTVWSGQGEIVVDEALTVSWGGGDGTWDADALLWSVSAYPGDTAAASFNVENNGNSDLKVVATLTIDQPLTGVVSSWDHESECVKPGHEEKFDLEVVMAADVAPGTALISFTFQRAACE